jgi:hypothetical protein
MTHADVELFSGQLPPGTAFDLFRGTAPVRNDEEEAYPTEVWNCWAPQFKEPTDAWD